MSVVLSSDLRPQSLKLTALALADWSDDEGFSFSLSMDSVAKTVGVTLGQANRLVHDLIAQGLLSVDTAVSGKPRLAPRCQLHLERISAWGGNTDASCREAGR